MYLEIYKYNKYVKILLLYNLYIFGNLNFVLASRRLCLTLNYNGIISYCASASCFLHRDWRGDLYILLGECVNILCTDYIFLCGFLFFLLLHTSTSKNLMMIFEKCVTEIIAKILLRVSFLLLPWSFLSAASKRGNAR